MDTPRRHTADDRPLVVVSGEAAGERPGGLLIVDAAGIRVIDHLDSGDLVASDVGVRRELLDRESDQRWMVEYSASGLEAIHRLEGQMGTGLLGSANPDLALRGNEIVSSASDPPRVIVTLDGTPRAMTTANSTLIVAVERDDPRAPEISLEGLDVDTGEPLLDVALPLGRVNGVACVSEDVAEAIASPSTSNPLRIAEAAQHEMFSRVGVEDPLRLWASGDPLPPDACRVRMRCSLPAALDAGASTVVEVEVENAAHAILASGPPYPVMLTSRWFDERGREHADTPTPEVSLDPVLTPRAVKILPLRVVAPSDPGRYEVRVTLVQHWRAWFDELDLDNCAGAQVEVTARPPTAVGPSGAPERGSP